MHLTAELTDEDKRTSGTSPGGGNITSSSGGEADTSEEKNTVEKDLELLVDNGGDKSLASEPTKDVSGTDNTVLMYLI